MYRSPLFLASVCCPDIVLMNNPPSDLPVILTSLYEICCKYWVFIFCSVERKVLSQFQYFLSPLFTILIFIVNKIDNKYWRTRIFYQIYRQSEIYYHFPHFPLGLLNLELQFSYSFQICLLILAVQDSRNYLSSNPIYGQK